MPRALIAATDATIRKKKQLLLYLLPIFIRVIVKFHLWHHLAAIFEFQVKKLWW